MGERIGGRGGGGGAKVAAPERMDDEGAEGGQAGADDADVAFDGGPDHDGHVVPRRVVDGDGGVGVDADDAHGRRAVSNFVLDMEFPTSCQI